MLAQAFYVAHFEAGFFGVTQRRVDRHQLAIRKDVAADKSRIFVSESFYGDSLSALGTLTSVRGAGIPLSLEIGN
jgi:hypothetical protein